MVHTVVRRSSVPELAKSGALAVALFVVDVYLSVVGWPARDDARSA